MPIIDPNAPVVNPPPLSFNTCIILHREYNLALTTGLEEMSFTACMASPNGDGSFTEPNPAIRFDAVESSLAAVLATAQAEIAGVKANAANASANAIAAYVAFNPGSQPTDQAAIVAGQAAAAQVTLQATNAGIMATALQDLQGAMEASFAAYINWKQPVGFPTLTVQ